MAALDELYTENTKEVFNLFNSWGLSHLYNHFLSFNITDLESIKLLTEQDLITIFPLDLGNRTKVRAKIAKWRIDIKAEKVITLNSEIDEWLQDRQTYGSSNASTPSTTAISGVHSTQSFDLEAYLKINKKFQITYGINKILPEYLRQNLIDDSVVYYIDTKQCMKHEDFLYVANEICIAFPNEPKTVYYNEFTRKGRLQSAYKTILARLRRNGLPTIAKRRKLLPVLDEESADLFPPLQPTEDQKWLKTHTTPFATVEAKWKSTVKERSMQIASLSDKNIAKILTDWPPYTIPDGPRLIDIDFEFLYPGKDLILLEKWNDVVNNVKNLMNCRIKDKYSINKLSLLNSYTGVQRDINFALLLHALLPPGGHVKDKNTKKGWKFSIADSQKSFILRLDSASLYNEVILQRRTIYEKYDLRMQPFILVVGNDDYSIINCIQVVYDNILYTFDSFIKALSCAFKIHYVFNLNYQRESNSVWQFLQCYVFEIPDKTACTNVNNLLSILKD